ncbi:MULTISPECIES: hypothetical protein [Olivibacter]|uniref:Fimbrillin-like protein n=1 Tax=Olivibacter jilunii TaxID=985016 RepID=A0ABW6B1P4_9SPHI|nr:hypothetical protein [Olivibacter sp. UJ_SKK_5.1]MDX3911961.1 hypothetical protein [Pseudosphingobacterium sp.]
MFDKIKIMKRCLPIILVFTFVFSCSKKDSFEKDRDSKQDRSITFDQAMSMIKSGTNAATSSVILAVTPNKKSTNINFSDFTGYSSCSMPEKTVNGITFKAFQGSSFAGDALSLGAAHAYSDALPGSYGSGMGIRYPFKQGSVYTIKTYLTGGDDIFYGNMTTRRYPTLQARLTNNPVMSTLCTSVASINITGTSEPTQIFPAIEKDAIKAVSIQLTADKCYDYLWLNVIPNTSGRSLSTAKLNGNMVIEEQNQFAVVGPESLTVNQVATYSVEAFSLPINSNFTWSVSGDFQIVGSNVGPSVAIKTTGLGGGEISISLNGCNKIVSKVYTSPIVNEVRLEGPSFLYELGNFSTFQIVKTGSSVNRVISQVTWTPPPGCFIQVTSNTTADIRAGQPSQSDYLIVSFLMDGVPITLKKPITIQILSPNPGDPGTTT